MEGVAARGIADAFSAPRGRDRFQAGSISVPSATRRYAALVRARSLPLVTGGWVAGRFGVVGPAHERYYYAHLEDWREGLAEGEAVSEGSVLGYCATVGAPPCVGPVSAGTWPPPRPANQFSEQFRPGREPARAASLRADRARGPACATPLLADPDTCA